MWGICQVPSATLTSGHVQHMSPIYFPTKSWYTSGVLRVDLRPFCLFRIRDSRARGLSQTEVLCQYVFSKLPQYNYLGLSTDVVSVFSRTIAQSAATLCARVLRSVISLVKCQIRAHDKSRSHRTWPRPQPRVDWMTLQSPMCSSHPHSDRFTMLDCR